MTDSDYSAFEAALRRLFAVYPKARWSPDAVDAWFAVLQDYELADVVGAITRCVQCFRYPQGPVPADVVEILEGGQTSRSLEAWTRLLRVVRTHGRYHSIAASRDPLTLAVVRDLGGWPAFCERCNDAEERPHLQREFERRHQAYQAEPPGEVPHHLPGLFEQENRLRGWDQLPEGDPRRALVLRDLAPVDLDAAPRPRPALPAPEPPAPERRATPEELERAKRYVAQLLRPGHRKESEGLQPALSTD